MAPAQSTPPRPKRKISTDPSENIGPVTDYGSSMVQWLRHRRPRYKGLPPIESERPSPSYIVDMLPPLARPGNGAETIPAKHLHSSVNKLRHPINTVLWTPEGRRLLTASSSGEFTLWNGMGFNFETIMQAHESAIRAATYSHSDEWLLSADTEGVVKYWQSNFNNVNALQGHSETIRGIAFAPTDTKFVTAADDSTLKIFDFAGGVAESSLTGHQWELRCVDWHPTKGLLVSGSKDHTVKLWDPRNGRCLTTLSGHKNQVNRTLFDPLHGQMLASAGKDGVIRVFDIRMMRDVFLLRGHDKAVEAMTWHPIHRNLLSTGGADGRINHYLLDEQNPPEGTLPTISPYDVHNSSNTPAQTIWPAHSVPFAHDLNIWSMAWHPLGHIMASGSNDRFTRFWTRPRPGDTSWTDDVYYIGASAAEAQGTFDRNHGRRRMREEEQEAEDEAEGLVDQKMPTKQPVMPGLPGISLAADGTGSQLPGIGGATPIAPPPLPHMPFPFDPNNMPDPKTLMEMFGGKLPPPPPNGAPGLFPPPPPGFMFPGGIPPPNPGLLPPGSQLPSGFAPPPPPPPPQNASIEQLLGLAGSQANTGVSGGGNASVRRRAPLPSQQESLQNEMRQGKYRKAR
ncbi:WD40 repeat-like protein [Aulographum hederae CBS 113979]|uniref:Polyadenylation factor subunit 2 n=1 Tax=Aulographum hederae CBS 113979 TaxID=1176131 RepID=A0A6G1HCP8_9PEZI|nr:WD40 repeat-like protein [Aulographum hederae CBS 113979]